MSEDLVWALVGLTLVVVELLTGTFYLLMLGVAAFGAALAAWLGQGFPVQVIVGAVIAALGCYLVHAYREKNKHQQMSSVDAGQPASFEEWVDRGGHLARVRYRGASWDAQIDAAEGTEPAPGAMLYVLSTHGNTLKVTTRRPT
jgi:membrane protein implicated in regulation of membrane protease activity